MQQSIKNIQPRLHDNLVQSLQLISFTLRDNKNVKDIKLDSIQVLHKVYLLINNIVLPKMNQNKYIQSQLERRQQRKILIQKNRAYLAQREEFQDKEEFAPQTLQNGWLDESTFTDPNYSTLIKTFTKAQYKYSDLFLLISKLARDVFSHYEAVIGIYSLGSNLFTTNNELQVMGTGIVPQLVKIMVNIEHPFLQVRVVSIMLRLMQRMSRDRIHIFFNTNLIPYNSLLVILSSQVDYLAQLGLNFVTRLIRSNYRIDTADNRVDLLQILQGLVVRWSNSSDKLIRILLCIRQFQIYFWSGRLKFNEKLCQLMNRLLLGQKQRQVNKSEVIKRIIEWFIDKKIIRRVANVFQPPLEEVAQKYQQLYTLVDNLYNFPLDSKCLQPKTWSKFILYYSTNKEGLLMLQKMGITQKLFELMHKYQRENQIIAVLIEIFQLLLGTYLRQQKQEKVKQMMQQKIVYLLIMNTFKNASICKQVSKNLHTTMAVIIRAYKFYDNVEILVDFDLISSLIKSSCMWDNMTMKASFKYLKQALQQLKVHQQMESPKSISISKLVVNDQNYKIIQQGLSANYLQGVQQLKTYFQNLKNVVKQSESENQRKGSEIFIQQKDKTEGHVQRTCLIADLTKQLS